MAGLNLNLGLSVFKREMSSLDEVQRTLENDGWERKGTMGDRVRVFERSGFSITAIEGPMATIIMPSGPIKGRFFSGDSVGVNRLSVIGASNKDRDKESQKQRDRDKNEMEASQKAGAFT